MHHVWAVRAVLPSMLGRSDGYILTTASAARLLTNIGAAPYSVTKHAAVALAEWLSVTHGDQGLKVSCLCPRACARPAALRERRPCGCGRPRPEAIEPEDVADSVVDGLRTERFLISPIPRWPTTSASRPTATVGSRGCGSCNVASAMRWAGAAERVRRQRTGCTPFVASDLLAVGLRPGDVVRYRRRWRSVGAGPSPSAAGDGSIGVRDAARPGRSSSSGSRCAGGPRGGTTWEPVADVAGKRRAARPAVTAFVDGSGPCRAFPVRLGTAGADRARRPPPVAAT